MYATHQNELADRHRTWNEGPLLKRHHGSDFPWDQEVQYTQSEIHYDQEEGEYLENGAQDSAAYPRETVDTGDVEHPGLDSVTQQEGYLAIGGQFFQDTTYPKAQLDDADVTEGYPDMMADQHLQALLPFLLPTSFNTPGLSPGHGGERRLPANSSRKSNNSDADGSVLDGTFPCLQSDCTKIYKTKSGLRYDHNACPF